MPQRNTTEGILGRLEEFLKTTSDTLISVAEAIGVSRAYFSTARQKKTEIGSDKIYKILLLYPQLSADWWITGQGFMLKGAKSLKQQAEIIARAKVLKTTSEEIAAIKERIQKLSDELNISTPKRSNTKKK